MSYLCRDLSVNEKNYYKFDPKNIISKLCQNKKLNKLNKYGIKVKGHFMIHLKQFL